MSSSDGTYSVRALGYYREYSEIESLVIGIAVLTGRDRKEIWEKARTEAKTSTNRAIDVLRHWHNQASRGNQSFLEQQER